MPLLLFEEFLRPQWTVLPEGLLMATGPLLVRGLGMILEILEPVFRIQDMKEGSPIPLCAEKWQILWMKIIGAGVGLIDQRLIGATTEIVEGRPSYLKGEVMKGDCHLLLHPHYQPCQLVTNGLVISERGAAPQSEVRQRQRTTVAICSQVGAGDDCHDAALVIICVIFRLLFGSLYSLRKGRNLS